jgi:hypothetical protein
MDASEAALVNESLFESDFGIADRIQLLRTGS